MYRCIYINIHTNIYLYVHTYIYIHTYIYTCSQPPLWIYVVAQTRTHTHTLAFWRTLFSSNFEEELGSEGAPPLFFEMPRLRVTLVGAKPLDFAAGLLQILENMSAPIKSSFCVCVCGWERVCVEERIRERESVCLCRPITIQHNTLGNYNHRYISKFSLCLSLFMHTCMFVCAYVCACLSVRVCMGICACVYACVWVCVCACVCVYV